MNADEVKWLDEEIAKRKKRLEAIVKGDLKPRLRNFRYVVNFEFPGPGNGLDPDLQPARADLSPYTQAQQSFVVKKGTLFDVLAVEQAYTAIGTLSSTGEAAQITFPRWLSRNIFDFYFKIYDSGSDREWQNDFLPSWVLASDNANGFWFGGPDSPGRGFLSGGSELVVTVAPWRSRNTPTSTGLSTLTAHNLQISFVGVEVVL